MSFPASPTIFGTQSTTFREVGQIANSSKAGEAVRAPRRAAVDVLFVSVSLLGFAGSSLRYRRYFPLMRRRGVRPRMVTAPPSERKRIGSPELPEGRERIWRGAVDGTPTTVLRLGGESPPLRLRWLLLRALWESATHRGPLLIHVLQPVKPDTLLHSLLLRASRRPKVASVTKDLKRPRSARERRLQRLQLDTYDAIFCQSAEQREALEQIGLRGEIHQLPNGVDTEQHRPADASERRALRERLGLPLDEPVFVYVGTVQERKGVDLLLEAWRELRARGKSGRLLVVGPRYDLEDPVDEEFRARIEQLISAPGMAESVVFTGTLPDVSEHLGASDAFVFPSRREGVPNAVLEAMARGLPCVLTTFSTDMSQFGCPGEHYLHCERDPLSLAAAIAGIAADLEAARETFGVRARELMVDTMRLDLAVDLHCEVYHSLASRSGRAALRR
jgi:glycosyltransferase involved in cell wall biosynthesis